MATVSIYTPPALRSLLRLETLREARTDGSTPITPTAIVAAAARAAVLSPRSLAGVLLAEAETAGHVTRPRAAELVRALLPPHVDATPIADDVLTALAQDSDSFPARLRPVYDTAQRTTVYLPTDR